MSSIQVFSLSEIPSAIQFKSTTNFDTSKVAIDSVNSNMYNLDINFSIANCIITKLNTSNTGFSQNIKDIISYFVESLKSTGLSVKACNLMNFRLFFYIPNNLLDEFTNTFTELNYPIKFRKQTSTTTFDVDTQIILNEHVFKFKFNTQFELQEKKSITPVPSVLIEPMKQMKADPESKYETQSRTETNKPFFDFSFPTQIPTQQPTSQIPTNKPFFDLGFQTQPKPFNFSFPTQIPTQQPTSQIPTNKPFFDLGFQTQPKPFNFSFPTQQPTSQIPTNKPFFDLGFQTQPNPFSFPTTKLTQPNPFNFGFVKSDQAMDTSTFDFTSFKQALVC